MAYPYQQFYSTVPAWYNQFYQPVQQPMQQPVVPAQQPAAQCGFVRVQSEQEARAYPVAPGGSITFIDESRPYCYTKTVGASQLDGTRFERYRLVKEDAPEGRENGPQERVEPGASSLQDYALKTDVERLWAALKAVERRIGGEQGVESAD